MIIFKPNPLWCFKGGGGGGAGVVDYPDYMKTFHGDILNDDGTDVMSSSMVDIMNAAIGNSPFTGEAAYDPDIPIAAMLGSVTDMDNLVALLSSGTTLDSLIANVLSTTRIDDAVDAFEDDLDARLDAEILPRFEAGMRDINAVTSSAFVLGKAVIEDGHTRQLARFSADLYMKAWGDDAIKVIALKLEYQKMLTQLTVETNRIKIVAKKEQTDTDLDITEADASWDLGVFQHGGNLLASIGGGVMTTEKRKKSQAASALGGAVSGAVAGAMIGASEGSVGGWWGAAIGAVIGAGMGLLE